MLEARVSRPAERMQALASLPALVKRTALAAWPRESIAALNGPGWSDFVQPPLPRRPHSGRDHKKECKQGATPATSALPPLNPMMAGAEIE